MSDFTDTLAELNRQGCAQMPMASMAVLRRSVAMLRKSGLVESCLQTGETVPDFCFDDQQGRSHTLYQTLEKGPVVISFFRGFWCPYCQLEFNAWLEVADDLSQLGATLIAVSPQAYASEKSNERCFIVTDQENKIAKQFGVVYSLSEDEKQLFANWDTQFRALDQNETWQLPLPSTYLIGSDRVVIESHVDVDYKLRTDPENIVAELARLKRPE